MKQKKYKGDRKVNPKHIEKLKQYLSPRDKALQEKYDKLRWKNLKG